jgi:hypothetical protein
VDSDSVYDYLEKELDLQGPGSSWAVLGGNGWSGGGWNGRMTKKKAKLGGITPSSWCQQSMVNNRQTRISSQIIQMYAEFSLEMPLYGGFRKFALLQSLFVKLVIDIWALKDGRRMDLIEGQTYML